MEIFLAILDIVVCIAVIVLVLFQNGDSSLGSTITGNTETYLGKNKGKKKDQVLAKATMIAGVILVVFTLILNVIFIVK